jgi:hypothetical protein
MNRPRLRASANSDLKGVGTRMENRAIGQPNPINVIGRDVARERQRTGIPTRLTVLIMVLTALAGLGIVGMRSDVMRIRYALSAAMEEEKLLQLEHNTSTVAMRKLRSPARLSSLAQELGFRRPEQIVDLSSQPIPTRNGQMTRGNP